MAARTIIPTLDFAPLRQAVDAASGQPKAERNKAILAQYVPPGSLNYAWAWSLVYPFHLVITQPRDSKYGDYRHLMPGDTHKISVNGNLPPQAFLLTYLHEVAHMMVVRLVGRAVSAHGAEWKGIFSQILKPMLRPEVFDASVLPAMIAYARNPKASSASDPALMRALHFTDLDGVGPNADSQRPLGDYTPQPGFRFGLKGKVFSVVEKRRTTYLCTDVATGKQYLVKAMAPVTEVKG